MLSADYQKELEKIVLERKKESMWSTWIGQLVAESLGGGIDSRKEIDLWLLQYLILLRVKQGGIKYYFKSFLV